MMSKARLAGLSSVLGAFILLSMVSMAGAMEHITFSVSPDKISKAGNVLIFASGLKPGQEVGVRTMMGGVLSDISFLAKPAFQKADKNGALASVWSMRGRTFKRLMESGTYNVELVDADGDTLATAKLEVTKEDTKK